MSPWISADSEAISGFRYDEKAHSLRVRFVSGGEYDYLYTPRSIFKQFKAAPKKGRFFMQHIRDAFLFRPVK